MIKTTEKETKRWSWFKWDDWDNDTWHTRALKRKWKDHVEPYFIDELFKLFYKEDFEIVKSDNAVEDFYDQIIFSLDSKYIREITSSKAWTTEEFIDALLTDLANRNPESFERTKNEQQRAQNKENQNKQDENQKKQNQQQKEQQKQQEQQKEQQQNQDSEQSQEQDKNEQDKQNEQEQNDSEQQDNKSYDSPYLNDIVQLLNDSAKEAIKEVENMRSAWGKFGISSRDKVVNMSELKKLGQALKLKNIDTFLKHFAASGFAGINVNRITPTNLLDSNQIFDILTPEEMLLNMFETTVLDYEKTGKLDFFVDVSGSMNDQLMGSSRIIVARCLVNMLRKYVAKIYAFETSITPYSSLTEFFTKPVNGGGTDIAMCVRKAHSKKRHSIIITDGDCNIYDEYSKYAYILCVTQRLALTSDKITYDKYTKRGQLACIRDNKIVILNEKNKNDY